jgi:uncharacterized protein DUF2800
MVFTSFATRRGTDLHELAQRMITLGVRLADTTETLNSYVNDAIGFRMTPEQVVYYSPECYGQADAISFRKGKLRVHDLKTGVTKCKMTQLKIYAALFCLEYGVKPGDIEIELRIYQNDAIQIESSETHLDLFHEITSIMSRITVYSRRIQELREEVYG